jgi:hypothetical protein
VGFIALDYLPQQGRNHNRPLCPRVWHDGVFGMVGIYHIVFIFLVCFIALEYIEEKRKLIPLDLMRINCSKVLSISLCGIF